MLPGDLIGDVAGLASIAVRVGLVDGGLGVSCKPLLCTRLLLVNLKNGLFETITDSVLTLIDLDGIIIGFTQQLLLLLWLPLQTLLLNHD